MGTKLSVKCKRNWKKWLCLGMVVGLLLENAGCGLARSEADQKGESLPIQSESVSGQVEEPEKTEAIHDFYDYANADWIREQEQLEHHAYSYLVSARQAMYERLQGLLDEVDMDSLDPQSDLYKVAYVYHQLMDQEYRAHYGNGAFKKFLDEIDRVESLDDLCELYQDENYENYNALMIYYVRAALLPD